MMQDILPTIKKNNESLELTLFKVLHEYNLVDCYPNVEIAIIIHLLKSSIDLTQYQKCKSIMETRLDIGLLKNLFMEHLFEK